MLAALYKAFAQLGDPALHRVIRLGVLGAVACYLALVVAVWLILPHVHFFSQHWADTGTGIALGLAAAVLPILVFPALVTTIMSAMLESVADAVEARHYPQLNWPRPQGWTEIMSGTVRFLLVSLGVNLLALPLYLVLLATGLAVALMVVVNGYLLGREYFELVAARRMAPKPMRLAFRNHLGQVWLAGAIIAILFAIPLLNLIAPVIAAAFMVHVFQSLRCQTDLL
ncbi:MAG TPA: EI24 domain-containing protein [Magnetospirillum sp.]|jgi:uncharacterized protein involved in cysteine biosynthesis|nr:EI24 domain-containing protein [Magnetospirillum sp.]